MTTAALALGSGLVAFGPLLALFSMIIYQKAQLVIVVTTAAFCFLLGSTVGAMFWKVFHMIGFYGPLAAMIPSVLTQFLARCGFVTLYHRVEQVIQESLEKEEEESRQETSAADSGSRTHPTEKNWGEIAKMRLQLNDAACGVASGVGFGGMHAILLYGTLLASEMSTNVGVLYQESCPSVPSLAVSAVYALCFFILDIFWMLFTFFGMRRRLQFHRGEGEREYRAAGMWLGNSRKGGNLALLAVLVTHFAAATLTTTDYFKYGCFVSVPSVFGVVLFTAYIFWAGVGRIYMPADQQVPEITHYNRDLDSSFRRNHAD